LEEIEKNKAKIAALKSAPQHDKKVEDKLMEKTDPTSKKAIQNLGKSNEEESKEYVYKVGDQ
jgi:hypothetical protein